MTKIEIDCLAVDNEENLIDIRKNCRNICVSLGFTNTEQVKITTAVSEIARNIYEYAEKGVITFSYIEKNNNHGLQIIAGDNGPGIKNLDKILEGKYISKTGMGAGIKGARSLMDDFQIVSESGKGTTVTIVKYLPPDVKTSQEAITKLTTEFKIKKVQPKDSLFVELETQNKELLQVLENLEKVNKELTETNQGIIALNNEMELKNAELERLNISLNSSIAQLNAKNAEMKAFNYTVSHDLKAPLRGITGYSQELTRKHISSLSERGIFCITQIAGASQQLDALIEDLLRFSRLETEILQRQNVYTKNIIENILAQRQSIIDEHSIELSLHIQDTNIFCWENGFIHAIGNLVDNAFKYSSKAKPPQITITTEVKDNLFLFRISDNGIGFDMKYHDRLFELFHRLVRSEDYEGTGAGLAIVKKVIDKQDGKIWAESEPGKGATFTFTIPLEEEVGSSQSTVGSPQLAVD